MLSCQKEVTSKSASATTTSDAGAITQIKYTFPLNWTQQPTGEINQDIIDRFETAIQQSLSTQ